MGQAILIKNSSTARELAHELGDSSLEKQIVAKNNMGSSLLPGQQVELPFIVYYVDKTTAKGPLAHALLLDPTKWPQIAKKSGVTSEQVPAGQILYIPIDLASQEAIEKDYIEIYAEKGQVLSRILQQYPGASIVGETKIPPNEVFKVPTRIVLKQPRPSYSWQKLSQSDITFARHERERLSKLLPSSCNVRNQSSDLRMSSSVDLYVHLLATTSWLEGYIPCMYLDPRGIVTVGIGTNLEVGSGTTTLDALLREVNFYRCESITWAKKEGEQNQPVGISSKPVPKEEVKACFEALKTKAKQKTTPGLPQTYFDPSMPFVLSFKDAIKLAKQHVQKEAARQISPRFKGYGSYPIPALIAILDMIYNLGIGTFDTFGSLKAAINSENWVRASVECHRKDWYEHAGKKIVLPGLHSRNLLTRELFLLAAQGQPS